MHPTKEEFSTCGDDKILRLWSIRSHEELAAKALPSISRAISYNNLGDILAVGMIDGFVAVIDAKTTDLRVCSSWKHSSGIITDIKFSSDGQYFAAASADTNIYIYKSEAKQTFSRQAVCKGHNGPVIHIDFSANSKFLQSNSSDYALMFWDIKVFLNLVYRWLSAILTNLFPYY
jgi:WD40 repeat protein